MIWFRLGCAALFAAVAMGAFGAHALKASLGADARPVYQTAVLYHLVHGLGLLAVGWLSMARPSALVGWAGWAFAAGIVLFSGSLYALSVTGIKPLGVITPLGGLAFLIGWLLLAVSAR